MSSISTSARLSPSYLIKRELQIGKSTDPPLYWRQRSSELFITITVVLGGYVDVLLYGLMVPVLPFILTDRVGASHDSEQYWNAILFGVYGVALTVGSPLSGWVADRTGRRRPIFVTGLFLLMGTTLMLCLARSLTLLVVARLLQGFSASIVWTVAVTVMVDTVAHEKIGKMLGIIAMANPTASLTGPVVGGVVFEKAGYYSVYAIAFSFIGADILLRPVMIEKKKAEQWQSPILGANQDEFGESSNLPSLDLITDIEPGTRQESRAFDTHIGSPPNEKLSESKAKLDVAPNSLSKHPRRWHSKLPHFLTLLASPRLLAALWGVIMQQTMPILMDTVLPLYVRDTFGWSATKSGLIFLPLQVPTIIIEPLAGKLSDMIGPRIPVVSGFLLGCPGLVLLRLAKANDATSIALLITFLIMIGLAGGLMMPAIMTEASSVVREREAKNPDGFKNGGAYAQAYGLISACQGVGGIIGAFLGGIIRDEYGWNTMAWVFGLLYGVSAIPATIYTGDGWLRLA